MNHLLTMMTGFAIRNAAGLAAAAVLVVAGRHVGQERGGRMVLARSALAVVSLLWIGMMVVVFINHLQFPLFLESLEGTIFQHFQRAAHGLPIYPWPSPAFIPFAYNPLYYVFCVPFSWVFGENLFTLRLVSVLATIGIGLLIFLVLRRETGSRWWGLVGAGLFAASYRAMDNHLDTAHADACLVVCAVAGTALIHYKRTRGMRLLGMAILIAAFWFKQHGALFAGAGLLYLSWDEGWRRSWPYWALTILLGPVTYIFLGPVLFGPAFHYFTYQVPSAWSSLGAHSFARAAALFARHYLWIGLAAGWWFVSRAPTTRRYVLTAWHFQLLAAVASAILGALDEGSSNNVFIPLATWLILCGVWGLARLDLAPVRRRGELVAVALVVVSFALVAFNPIEVMTPRRAHDDYRELISFLRGLHGRVYAPALGQLPADYRFSPGVHFVALEDLIRGPNRDVRDNPVTRRYLASLLDPTEPVYILDNYPLSDFESLAYLDRYFVLEADLGDRFRSLRVLPARWDLKWPRYLYRLDPRTLVDVSRSSPSP